MFYKLELDPHTGILRARLKGHWTIAVAERFSIELEERMIEARRIAGRLRLLLDATEHESQTAEVIHYMIERRKTYTRSSEDKVAICAASPFNRAQAVRRGGNGNGIFSSAAQARAWLLAPDEQSSAA